MKYYIIAGEASGDMHGANLLKELKLLDNNAAFRCWGGDRMKSAGGEIVKHYRELAFMGFTEVILNLRTILRNISFCKDDILEWKPDVLILIDYPGFNLRIAEFAKKNSIRVVYYISPQVWAWKQSRVEKIKRFVDMMLVILPFEKEFYKKFNYDVEYVGHPLLDEIISQEKNTDANWKRKNGLDDKLVIALLPGSRVQEIKQMLPLMLSVIHKFPDYHFAVSIAPSVDEQLIKTICEGFPVKFIANDSYSLLRNSYAALVTSGTATLETALFKVPEVVCYKGGNVSYMIARQLVNVKYISLVNLIMEKEVVKELIQSELTAKNIATELEKILNSEKRKEVLKSYEELREKLGGSGASARVAGLIWQTMSN
ncbi:MAG: lipid-A-disaccharide synthase [Bacteroidia bacterium]|nr:lipid-A-disaccharide synthase [Bacteroidia bacterium]